MPEFKSIDEQFLYAAQRADITAMSELNEYVTDFNPAALVAAREGKLEVLVCCYEWSNMYYKRIRLSDVIQVAARSRQKEIFECCIPWWDDECGEMPWAAACALQNEDWGDIVALCLKNPEEQCGMIASFAASLGRTEIVEMMLNRPGVQLETMMLDAINSGHIPVTNMLYEKLPIGRRTELYEVVSRRANIEQRS